MGIASGVFVAPADRAAHAATQAGVTGVAIAPDCGMSLSCAIDTPWSGVLVVLALVAIAAGTAARRGRRKRSQRHPDVP